MKLFRNSLIITSSITFLSILSFVFLSIWNDQFTFESVAVKISFSLLFFFLMLNILGIAIFFVIRNRHGQFFRTLHMLLITKRGVVLQAFLLVQILLLSVGVGTGLIVTQNLIPFYRILPVLLWLSLCSIYFLVVTLSLTFKKKALSKVRISPFDILIFVTSILYAISFAKILPKELISSLITNRFIVELYSEPITAIAFPVVLLLVLDVWFLGLWVMTFQKDQGKVQTESVSSGPAGFLESDSRAISNKQESSRGISGERESHISKLKCRKSRSPLPILRRHKKTMVWAGFFLLFIFAMFLRYISLPATNSDLGGSVIYWYDQLAANGGFAALKDTSSFSNYNTPYLYLLLLLLNFRWIPKLVGIKLISIIFDFIGAIAVYKTIKHFTRTEWAFMGALLTLLTPVVWVNSAYWGQSDGIFTAFLLFSLYYFLKSKPVYGMVLFSVAFSFKLQAVFLVPFILFAFIYKQFNWKLLFLFPMTYFIMALPAIIAGQPFSEILTIYVDQAKNYAYLSLNAASMYGFFNFSPNVQYSFVGFVLLSGFMIALCVFGYKKQGALSDKVMILVAVMSLFVVPFVLPRMHERYFYPAAVASILLLFTIPRLWYVALIVNLTTYLSYFTFLWRFEVVPLAWLTVLNLLVIIGLFIHWFNNYIRRPRPNLLSNKDANIPDN